MVITGNMFDQPTAHQGGMLNALWAALTCQLN
jgi:hypothetical protein